MALDEARTEAPSPAPASERPGTPEVAARPKVPRRRLFVMGALVVAAAGAAAWWAARRGLESTDDAQVDADVVAIAPRTGGTVTKVSFEENATVHAGDVLAEIDPEPATARLAQAEAQLESAIATVDAAEAEARLAETNARANKSAASASLGAAAAGAGASKDLIAEADARVASAEAALAQATTERDRTARLVASGSISSALLDQTETARTTAAAALDQAKAYRASLKSTAAQAQSRVDEANAKVQQTRDVDVVVAEAQARAKAARAKVAELRAARDLAALELSYTKIVAPRDGVVSKKNVAVGQTVTAGAPIVQLVPIQSVWVTANFKETQIGRMREGQRAEVTIDACPGVTFHGKVESFSAATGARFALLPPDNASGNFTKIVQRVPVRVRLEEVPRGVVLRPGMSAELTVDTRI